MLTRKQRRDKLARGEMLVPADLLNPVRVSGFDYVGYNPSSGSTTPKPYQADVYGGTNDKAGRKWKGPRRATPTEAAQDYCNFVNGSGVAIPHVLKTAGHEYVVDERDKDPEYQAALGVMRDRRAQRAGKQGYVYLIIEDNPGGALTYGKVGYSTNPQKRVAELQTGNPRSLKLHLMKPATEAEERRIHRKYIKDNALQEWFRLTKELLLEWGAEHQVV